MNEEKMYSLLVELEASASALQQCLLDRETELIWQGLERQEHALAAINGFQLEEPDRLEQEVAGNSDIRRLLMRSLWVVQSNRALSRRFLDVVGRTLSRLVGNEESSTYTDTRSGGASRAPVLVQRMG